MTTTINDAMSQGMTDMGDQMTGMITTALPIALGLVGAVLAITFGIRLFKKLTGR